MVFYLFSIVMYSFFLVLLVDLFVSWLVGCLVCLFDVLLGFQPQGVNMILFGSFWLFLQGFL